MFVSNGTLVTKTPLLPRLDSSYFPHMPPMSNGWPSAYAAIYRTHLWPKVVIEKRAKALARLPLPVYRRDGQNRPRADEHPLAVLLRNPNPGMSPFDLWEWTQSTYDIYGNAFWYKKRDRRAPAGMWIFPLHPASMHLDETADLWSFDNGKFSLRDIPRTDLVHFKTFNPDSISRGMSPLEPLRSTLENEWNARTATSAFWKRGARPGTYLIHPKNLSEQAQSRLKKQVDEVMSGAENTGSTMLLEEGLEPKPMSLSANEAQYIETRKLNREEVCAAYDMPPPAVHILDRATFSNITEQFRSVYRDTMAPICADFEGTIETDLRAVDWPSDEVYAEFLMDEVLRGDFESRQTALAQANYMTLAEKRQIENLPFIEGTDRIFLNAGILPLDAIDAAAAADREAAEQAGEGNVPLQLVRAALGRLSWQRELEQVDPKSLIDGLGEHSGAVLQQYALEAARSGDVTGLKQRIRALADKEQ